MNPKEYKQKYQKQDPSFSELAEIVGEASFREACEAGEVYANEHQMKNEETFPFAIDKVGRSKTRVVFKDSVKPLIEKMKSLAKEQSDDGIFKFNHYEAVFCLVGEQMADKIIVRDAFWDESGFKPNKSRSYDPDNYDSFGYDSFYDHSSNVTTVSDAFIEKMEQVCSMATPDNNLVVIYGHTHPQLESFGKINNYPSMSDVISSVGEAANYYDQPNGKCLFLNAIVNADGDLNIFGYDIAKQKFVVFDKLVYQRGDKIKSLSEENYPLSQNKGTLGE